MGTGIDHLMEQRTGWLSEVSCYSTLSIVSVWIIILWPPNLLCSLCHSFWPLAIFLQYKQSIKPLKTVKSSGGADRRANIFWNYIFMGQTILVTLDLDTIQVQFIFSFIILCLDWSKYLSSHSALFLLLQWTYLNPVVKSPKNGLFIKLTLMGWVQHHTSCGGLFFEIWQDLFKPRLIYTATVLPYRSPQKRAVFLSFIRYQITPGISKWSFSSNFFWMCLVFKYKCDILRKHDLNNTSVQSMK